MVAVQEQDGIRQFCQCIQLLFIPHGMTENTAEVPGDDQYILFRQSVLLLNVGKPRYFSVRIPGYIDHCISRSPSE